MPTSVGPNTKGEENLVFAYDLGDVSNSYKGEPVENLQIVGEGNVYTNVFTTNTTAELVDMMTPFGNKAWKITIPASGTNGYSNTRVQGPTVVINRDGTPYFQGAYVWMSDSDYALWEQSSTYIYKYSTGTNGMSQWSHRPAFDRKDRANRTWKLWGSVDSRSQGGTGNQYHTFFKNGTLTNDLVFYIVAPMWGVNKLHPVQFTAGTRSATQGLLDLTGNSTIDLSNVSFDSNAQMTFDGTDDILNTGLFSGRNPSTNPFTVEAWIKSDTTSGARMWIDATSNGSNQRFYASMIDSTTASIGIQGSGWTDSTPSHTNWTHQVIVMDGSKAKAYADGEFKFEKPYTSYTLAGQLNIGGRVSYRWLGDISRFKVYDRALTPAEILQNYNATKSRFNL